MTGLQAGSRPAGGGMHASSYHGGPEHQSEADVSGPVRAPEPARIGCAARLTTREAKLALIFHLLSEGAKNIPRDQLRRFANATGFDGTDEEWIDDYQHLCDDHGIDPERGPGVGSFIRLVNDMTFAIDNDELTSFWYSERKRKLIAGNGEGAALTSVSRDHDTGATAPPDHDFSADQPHYGSDAVVPICPPAKPAQYIDTGRPAPCSNRSPAGSCPFASTGQHSERPTSPPCCALPSDPSIGSHGAQQHLVPPAADDYGEKQEKNPKGGFWWYFELDPSRCNTSTTLPSKHSPVLATCSTSSPSSSLSSGNTKAKKAKTTCVKLEQPEEQQDDIGGHSVSAPTPLEES